MEKGGSVMNVWESVISRSRVNDGCCYDEARLPEFRWEWPKGTWFQARVEPKNAAKIEAEP
jgi:hypothetical protein